MVCIPCFVIPFFLFIWYRYLQPIVLKFWNPWQSVQAAPVSEKSPPDSKKETSVADCIAENSTQSSKEKSA